VSDQQYETQAVADAIGETWALLAKALINVTGKTPIGAIIVVTWHDGSMGTVHLPTGMPVHEGMRLTDIMAERFRRTVEIVKKRLNTIAKQKTQ
jgi:hypothetical protein